MTWGPTTKDVSTRTLGKMQIRVGSADAYISNSSPILTSANSVGALANTVFNSTREFHDFVSGFPARIDGKVPISDNCDLQCGFQEITPFNMALSFGIDPFGDISATVDEVARITSLGTTTGDITVSDAGGVVTDTFMVLFDTATTGSVVGVATGLVHTFADLTSAMEPDNGGNPYFTIPADFFSGTWDSGESFVFKTTEYVAGTTSYTDPHSGLIKLGVTKAPDYVRAEAIMTFPNEVNTMTIVFPRAQVSSSIALDAGDTDVAIPTTFAATPADSTVSGGNAAWDDMPLGVIIFA